MAAPLPSLQHVEWLRAASTQAVLACLRAGGHTGRVVGGAVRNALLGRPVADIDIATDATPAQVVEAARVARLKTIPTGLQHGTVTVVAKGRPFEVTTLRHDVETDGRRAKVAFTDDWTADASRRDLTLNALYCDADGTIFDPLGGLDDLLARRVRFIGDARQRIREDYLRILRFFRFTAEYADGAPDAAGMAAAVAERHGLARLSAERVRSELVRLLVARRAVEMVEEMAAHGLLTAILPVAPRPGILRRIDVIGRRNGLAIGASLKLAALAVAVEEDAERLAGRLRLSAEERDTLRRSASPLGVSPSDPERAARAALYRQGRIAYVERALIAWAKSRAADDDHGWRSLVALPDRWPVPTLPMAGRDLLARGLSPGPRIGEALGALEAWWIDRDFPDDRAAIEAQLATILAATPGN